MENRSANTYQPLNQNEYQPVQPQTQPYEPVPVQNQNVYQPSVQINQAQNQNMHQPVYPTQPVNSASNEVKLLNQPISDENVMGKIYDDEDEFMSDIRRGFVIKVYGILTATLLFTALL